MVLLPLPYVLSFDNSDTIKDIAVASTKGANEIESASSSTGSKNMCDNKDTISADSSPKYVVSENKECSTENVEEIVQNPSVSSSASKMPICEFDFKTKFETEFKTDNATSPQNTPVKSPTKSFLGKRPSPRKGICLRDTADDSETEVKKVKLAFPEKDDQDE